MKILILIVPKNPYCTIVNWKSTFWQPSCDRITRLRLVVGKRDSNFHKFLLALIDRSLDNTCLST